MLMHAERDIVTANPSVRHTPVLYLNECTYRPTLSTLWGAWPQFSSATSVTKFQMVWYGMVWYGI